MPDAVNAVEESAKNVTTSINMFLVQQINDSGSVFDTIVRCGIELMDNGYGKNETAALVMARLGDLVSIRPFCQNFLSSQSKLNNIDLVKRLQMIDDSIISAIDKVCRVFDVTGSEKMKFIHRVIYGTYQRELMQPHPILQLVIFEKILFLESFYVSRASQFCALFGSVYQSLQNINAGKNYGMFPIEYCTMMTNDRFPSVVHLEEYFITNALENYGKVIVAKDDIVEYIGKRTAKTSPLHLKTMESNVQEHVKNAANEEKILYQPN